MEEQKEERCILENKLRMSDWKISLNLKEAFRKAS